MAYQYLTLIIHELIYCAIKSLQDQALTPILILAIVGYCCG